MKKLSSLLLIFAFSLCYSLFVLTCDRNLADTIATKSNSIFSSDSIYVCTKEEISALKINYTIPDFHNPILLYQDQNDCTKTLNLANFVKINRLNRKAIEDTRKDVSIKLNLQRTANVESVIQIENYLIAMTGMVYHDQDLMLWRIRENRFELLHIYPSAVGICLYCSPKFHYSNKDTLVIGTDRREEGDIYGFYDYLSIKNDSIHVFRKQNVSGSYPNEINNGDSNPIHGATCKCVLDIFYDEQGVETHTVIDYDCRNIDGNTIYGTAQDGKLSLYEMSKYGYVRDFLKDVSVEKLAMFRVGELANSGGTIYLAIEFQSNWYWTLREQVTL